MVVVINNPTASNTPIIAFILAINCNIFPSIISNIITLLHLVTITLFYSQFEFFVTTKNNCKQSSRVSTNIESLSGPSFS